MKPMSVSADYATLLVPGEELARLSDLVGRELDLQESRTEVLNDEDRQALDAIYKTLNLTITEMWQEEARRGRPFHAGERVELVPQYAEMTGVDPGTTGVVVSQNGEDKLHDCDWCLIRLDDGGEIEMPAIYLRRTADSN